MKIDYSIKYLNPNFDFESWLIALKKGSINKTFHSKEDIDNEYDEVVMNFRNFLNSVENVSDKDGNPLTPLQIYNAINYFKIRIEKLILIFNLRLYKTYNVNKNTQVRYIVMRAFWISDETGKPMRYFSKNLGAENKVLSNGKIPTHLLNSIEEDILTLMWDLYGQEYLNFGYESGMDENGNWFFIKE